MESSQELLERTGWTLVRHKNHQVWRCPCGEHQITVANTPSDFRSQRNNVADILKTGCPSLKDELTDKKPSSLDSNAVYECHFCGVRLDHNKYDRKWVLHGTVATCLRHKGIEDWHKEQLRAEKKTQKTLEILRHSAI